MQLNAEDDENLPISICCFVESITWKILPDVSVTLFVGQNPHVRVALGFLRIDMWICLKIR